MADHATETLQLRMRLVDQTLASTAVLLEGAILGKLHRAGLDLEHRHMPARGHRDSVQFTIALGSFMQLRCLHAVIDAPSRWQCIRQKLEHFALAVVPCTQGRAEGVGIESRHALL